MQRYTFFMKQCVSRKIFFIFLWFCNGRLNYALSLSACYVLCFLSLNAVNFRQPKQLSLTRSLYGCQNTSPTDEVKAGFRKQLSLTQSLQVAKSPNLTDAVKIRLPIKVLLLTCTGLIGYQSYPVFMPKARSVTLRAAHTTDAKVSK